MTEHSVSQGKVIPVQCPGCGTAVVPDVNGRMPSHTIGVNAPCNFEGHTVKSATEVLRFNETYDANARRRGQYDER